eukprot:scaffold1068_cov375-Prasinococcus_capsulatus_cf.AAC.28
MQANESPAAGTGADTGADDEPALSRPRFDTYRDPTECVRPHQDCVAGDVHVIVASLSAALHCSMPPPRRMGDEHEDVEGEHVVDDLTCSTALCGGCAACAICCTCGPFSEFKKWTAWFSDAFQICLSGHGLVAVS